MSAIADATDQQLLARYLEERAEEAFAALVARHLNLVYSAALRQVCSPQLAEDVSQSVFTDLARNAHRLAADTILEAWLYKVTCRTAVDVVRREARRQVRERIAAELNAMNATDPDWTRIAPLLDEAMSSLDQTDRAAVLLRYFENQSLREVGQRLGVTDNAAQKRLARAVEQLRKFFAKRGVSVGASGLVVVLSAKAIEAAPAGLAAALSAATALASPALPAVAAASVVTAVTMTTLQKILITTAIVAAVGAALYQAREAAALRAQNQQLRQALADQAQASEAAAAQAGAKVAGLQAENSRLSRNEAELLKLRGEVGRLRTEVSRPAVAPRPEPNRAPETNPTPAFQTYASTNRARVKWGQTLITDPWQVPSGKWAMVFATLQPGKEVSELTVKLKFVELPKDSEVVAFFQQSAQGVKAAYPRAEWQGGLMDPEPFERLLKHLTQAGDCTLREMTVATASGVPASIASGATEADQALIQLSPTISADGNQVEVELTSELHYPTAPKAQ